MYSFAIILCFLKEKTNKSSFLCHRRDRQYASNNERSKTFKNFTVNLWFNSQFLLNSKALMGSW